MRKIKPSPAPPARRAVRADRRPPPPPRDAPAAATGAVFRITIETDDPGLAATIRARLPEAAKVGLRRLRPAPDLDRLTARQREVLGLLLEGRSNKEIGRLLGLSPFTVRNHVSDLFAALGVSSREAVRALVGAPP